jgi:uridine monophosphate synthetase
VNNQKAPLSNRGRFFVFTIVEKLLVVFCLKVLYSRRMRAEMESFFTCLEKRVDASTSLLCVGLDPHIPDLAESTAASALNFCLNLVKRTSPYAAAFKPNVAFFEVFGAEGWTALKQVIEAIHEEASRLGTKIPVILDAKRGDIASTAEAYAQSAFETLGADCVTLNPYLGKDSIEPFIQNSEKGVFLLCKTSNAGSMDLQNLFVLPVGAERPMPLYLYVAQLAGQWNEKNNVGVVVGATHPQIMEMIRAAAPDLWFLSPGVGAQGGELKSALQSGLRKDGKGILLPVSRAISRAADPAKAAAEMRDQIQEMREQIIRRGEWQ